MLVTIKPSNFANLTSPPQAGQNKFYIIIYIFLYMIITKYSHTDYEWFLKII